MASPAARLVADIRTFNRRYTRLIGLLDEKLSRSDFTLTEARVLFELGHRSAPSAVDIAADLRLDPAYLARILRRFGGKGLVRVAADRKDARRRRLALTPAGRRALAALQAAADRDVGALTAPLAGDAGDRLRQALATVTALLGLAEPQSEVTVRPHRAGDIGWIVQCQGRLYADEYGWDGSFEALAAEIGAAFLRQQRPGRDFCWIAELDEVAVGAVMLVEADATVAKLRLLHVEACARGRGVGSLLVERCIDEARRAGYRRLTLWTNDVLTGARRLYEKNGFRLTDETPHRSFGKDLVGQTFERDL